MTCQHCNGPGVGNEPGQCCWARAKEIEKFRKKVFRRYICNVLFEMIISISSVVTDIITFIFYVMNGKWELAALSAIPVILPTTVFTNVYLSNKHRDSNNMSSNTPNSSGDVSNCLATENETESGEDNSESHGEHEAERCFNAKTCCRGCSLLCNKDLNIRKGGKRIVKKYMRRSAKYFFGTIVLRFIAWTWYLKALIFGYEALRAPKKYMTMVRPDAHWSYELLTRLDFLQAALENAPQCCLQMYALITDSTEARGLGILTLTFSFIDFVRVAVAVQWNINKGPVVAPRGCYGSTLWNILNTCSWILLYSARSCALALVMATSQGVSIIYVALGFLLHMIVFTKLFSSAKFGVAAQKVIVTSFISLFFLPELDSEKVDILIQFYYAALLIENTLFIIPWKGLEHVYCENLKGWSNPKPEPTLLTDSSTASRNCLIQPVLVVLMVPAFTVFGIILRLAAARRVARFKASHPETEKPMTMEERVASIYNRKWTKLTYRDLLTAFIRMLRKEVKPTNPNAGNAQNDKSGSSRSNSILLISGTLGEDLRASQTFIRKSFSMIVRCKEDDAGEPSRPSQMEHRLTFPRVKDPRLNPFADSPSTYGPQKQFQNDLGKEDSGDPVPRIFFAPACSQNSTPSSSGTPIFRDLHVKFLKVESPEGEIVELDYYM